MTLILAAFVGVSAKSQRFPLHRRSVSHVLDGQEAMEKALGVLVTQQECSCENYFSAKFFSLAHHLKRPFELF